MGLFGKILKTGFDVVNIPIDIVKDAATLGGSLTDEEKPYTAQRVERLAEDGEEIRKEIDKL